MKNDWLQRGLKATEQEKNYMENITIFSSIKEKIDYLDEIRNTEEYDKTVKNQITKFIENKKIFSSGFKSSMGVLIEVDMKDISPNIYGKKLNNNIEKYNNQVVTILDNYNNCCNYKKEDLFNFIYVVQRNDGMIAVVGKTSFYRNNKTDGDLYKRLDTNRLVGTENIILRTLLDGELAEKVDKLLTNYYKKAWIIPIPVSKKEKKDSFVKECEKELGEHLINEGIQILNFYSHI